MWISLQRDQQVHNGYKETGWRRLHLVLQLSITHTRTTQSNNAMAYHNTTSIPSHYCTELPFNQMQTTSERAYWCLVMLVWSFPAVTLTWTRWPWYIKLTSVFIRCRCITEMKFLGQGFQKLEHKQDTDTHRKMRLNPVPDTFMGGKCSCIYLENFAQCLIRNFSLDYGQ